MCPTVRAQNANSALRHNRLSPAFVGCQSRATWDGDMYEQRTGSAPPCVIWVLWGPKKRTTIRENVKIHKAEACVTCSTPGQFLQTPLFCLGRWWRKRENVLSDWLKLIPFLSLPIKHAGKKKNVSSVLRKFNYKEPANKLQFLFLPSITFYIFDT